MTLTEIFEQLIVIPSPTRHEAEAAGWVRAFCEGLGFTVEGDGAAERVGGNADNLLVRVPGGDGPTLLFCAHIDTVESGDAPIRFVRENDVYRSDGDTILGADDKTGCACLLALLQHIKASGAVPHGELRVVFSVVEEDGCEGARRMAGEWLEGVDAAFALDHSLPHEIVTTRSSKEQLDVTVHGIGGHACSPDGKVNAAHLLAHVLTRLPSGRIDERSTCNIGIVRAGHAVNVIPPEAYASIEVRSLDADRLTLYVDDMVATIEETVAEMEGASVDIARRHCYPACDVPADALPVRLAQDAIRAGGAEPALVETAGGSDANWLCGRGVPTVTLGCGMHGAHATHERAEVTEMEACVALIRRIAGV